MTCLPRPVTKMNCAIPASLASSTAYWMTGLSTTGNISFGTALVAGRKRVPMPATGKTALRIGAGVVLGCCEEKGDWSYLHDEPAGVHLMSPFFGPKPSNDANIPDGRGGVHWVPRSES